MTSFFRMLDIGIDEKAVALKRAIRNGTSAFEVVPDAFSQIPGSPFAYWVGPRITALFSTLPRLETGTRVARAGGQTSDDGRYLRAWWEVASHSAAQWRTYVKGGAPSSFYVDQPLLANWDDGRSTFPGFLGRPGRASEKPSNVQLYFLPGITWPLRASRFAPQVMPANCIFTVRGYAIIEPVDSIGATIALTSSTVFDFLAKLLLGRFEFPEFVVGAIQQLPLPTLPADVSQQLASLTRKAWSLKRSRDTSSERSHAFILPQVLNERVAHLDRSAIEAELQEILKKIDDAAFVIYGISEADRAVIEAAARRPKSAGDLSEDACDAHDEDADEEAPGHSGLDEVASWLVGVTFGRFDERLATGERAVPREPEPFDALPSRSPGMYPEGDEPASRPDILVDDEGHADDVVARVRDIAERVRVDVPERLRGWLAKEFFPLHIKMYSRSGRRAPVYWQLGTPSGSYSVWLYIHAFSKDTLFRVQNDYVAPKLAHEERRLESLSNELRDGATAAQRKALAAQGAVVEELRAFLDEVKRVVPLWAPNLDDGVVINFAPLWRLVPQNKAWQKELKATWDALCEGNFDWAHLAMHLWPERVVPKCAKDRSLAIAHALEDVFWAEGADGKWTSRGTPTRGIGELVRERTSPAVKSALKSLLEAPVASGKSAGRNGGGRRKAAAVTEGGV
ncbi:MULTISPECIES: BREX-1 system adenine-specific DNA-methyltransferase PglX [unclassified Anaeromyxobacter]|uniref:BREX-1 system adenine-specific DNA-methyltransferase PglX n=1 Tax=unclassified Anaeromyxobacter TaxID=2620896 RepID=UPI001F571D27|nr:MULTISPECIES: BREX-1 system adenine-specific DNA-methyltransferase PglX [unclassified Anaeromyxobacter]